MGGYFFQNFCLPSDEFIDGMFVKDSVKEDCANIVKESSARINNRTVARKLERNGFESK